MIRAGERLFAERGINAVSMREVAAAARQLNNSAVRYHFGSKDGLADAIFHYRMARIDERRRAMLLALDGSGRGSDLRALLEAIIYPLSESLGYDHGASWYARFLRQVVFAPGFDIATGTRHEVTKGLATALDRLEGCVSGLATELRAQRLAMVFTLIVSVLADHEAALASSPAAVNTPLLAAALVDATAAILEAPVSDATAQELGRSQRTGA
jgi:AcrR family transcriptional regulator